MSNETTPQRLLAAPTSVPDSPPLDLLEIQGDVLIGLQKNFERFIFFKIAEIEAFKSALRKHIPHRITSTLTVRAREYQLRDYKTNRGKDPLPLIGLNLGFTNTGIQKLSEGVDLGDPSFTSGAATQAPSLGDALDGTGKLTNWKPEFLSNNIDGVFLVTGGTKAAVDGEAQVVLAILGGAITVIFHEIGHVRPGLEKGHEHFGWLDGVSQPGVKGLSDPFPGQRVLDPGHFVFGYPGQAGPPPLAWMNNGSFMVFRRLTQLVPEFSKFIRDVATEVQVTDTSGNAGITQMDPVLLGARIVGRWKSGAPLALTPSQDDTTLGADPNQNNNFDFSGDRDQRRCPFSAHIRKTNPRADFDPTKPESSQQTDVDPHRIIRAGIPFGPEVSPAEQSANATTQERGLMFVCYQTSISNQFEFVQKQWMNNEGFIFGKTRPSPPNAPVVVGIDPLIGQKTLNGQPQPITADEPIPNYPTGNVRSTLHEPQNFIIPTGGAYFFVPSIVALQNLGEQTSFTPQQSTSPSLARWRATFGSPVTAPHSGAS
jgi:Dyp-type peroxidase family